MLVVAVAVVVVVVAMVVVVVVAPVGVVALVGVGLLTAQAHSFASNQRLNPAARIESATG